MRQATVAVLLLVMADVFNPFAGAFFHLGEDQEEASFVGVARHLKSDAPPSVIALPPRVDIGAENVGRAKPFVPALFDHRAARADLSRRHTEWRTRLSDADDVA